ARRHYGGFPNSRTALSPAPWRVGILCSERHSAFRPWFRSRFGKVGARARSICALSRKVFSREELPSAGRSFRKNEGSHEPRAGGRVEPYRRLRERTSLSRQRTDCVLELRLRQ